MAQVKIEVQYRNQSSVADEARFVFPVEEDSAVYSFEADIGDRHLVAKCKDKEVAHKEYEKAREAGKLAILMSETSTSGDIFEYRLGNIPAKETVTIRISMFSELSCEVDGALRFHLPFVLNQRYGNVPKDEVYKNEPKSKEFSFNAVVNWPVGIENIKAEEASQKIKVEFEDDRRKALISLMGKFDFEKDMLFYVYYKNVRKPHAIMEKAEKNGKDVFGKDTMMVNFFPQLPDYEKQVSQEYIFIVDRSGSMQGERIESAKQTLLFFLKSLPVECAFNVISFSNSYEFLFPDGSQQYSQESMAAALKFHKELFASGGTELLRAMNSLSSIKPYKGYFRQVFLMTDGEVYDTKNVIAAIKSQAKEARFFAVGIGSGSSTELVKGIARAGNGKAVFVMENDNLNKKVMSLLKLSMQPVANNMSLVAKDASDKFSFTAVPKSIPSIFSEERFILYLVIDKLDKDLKSITLMLSGKLGDSKFEENFTVDFVGEEIPDMYVHRLCSRKLIQQLEEDDLDDSKGKEKAKIISLATTANLTSKYTAFQAESDIPEVECQRARMMCLSGPIQCNYACAPPAQMRAMSACSMPMARIDIDMAAPPMFGASSKGAPPQLFGFSSGNDDAISFDSDAGDEQEVESLVSVPKDTLTFLISLQTFDGSWKLDENLAQFFHSSIAELQKRKPSVDDKTWATALAITLMRQKFSQQKNEWELLVNKALRWLKSQSLGKMSVDDVCAAAGKLIPNV